MTRGGTLLERLTRLAPDTVLGSLVRAPLKLIPRNTVLKVRSGLNRGASWISGASVHGCWLGTYEAEKQQVVARLVRPGMTAWDVGANAGFYTLAFSRLVGERGRVYAFEPLETNVRNLRAHVELNDARNTTIIAAALGAKDGTVGFATAASNAMGRVVDSPASSVVPCMTLDSFVARHPESAPDVLKVDIEGGEGAMLEGGEQFLRRRTPAIILSLHGAEQQRRCRTLLESLGYAALDLDGSPLEPGADRDEILAVRRAA